MITSKIHRRMCNFVKGWRGLHPLMAIFVHQSFQKGGCSLNIGQK